MTHPDYDHSPTEMREVRLETIALLESESVFGIELAGWFDGSITERTEIRYVTDAGTLAALTAAIVTMMNDLGQDDPRYRDFHAVLEPQLLHLLGLGADS